MSRKISWNVLPCDGDLGHQEDNITAVAHTFAPILISLSFKLVSDQSLIGSGVASVRRKLPRLGERMKLEPNGIGGERSARQPRPLDRPLAFLDPLLARPALVVEGHDALSRAAHVRHDEADAGIKFSGMPFNLGDDPPRLGPASGLIAEARMGSAHMVRRTPDRAREQIADPALQNLVGR